MSACSIRCGVRKNPFFRNFIEQAPRDRPGLVGVEFAPGVHARGPSGTAFSEGLLHQSEGGRVIDWRTAADAILAQHARDVSQISATGFLGEPIRLRGKVLDEIEVDREVLALGRRAIPIRHVFGQFGSAHGIVSA
jgi:hypothetical protein